MSSYLTLFIVFLVFFGCGTVECQQQKCGWTDPETKLIYDFSALISNDKDYYLPKNGKQDFDCWINVCRSLLTDLCGASDVAGCAQYSPNPGGKFSIGKASTLAWMRLQDVPEGGYGVTATHTGGIQSRMMQIDFICDESAGPGTPTFLTENERKDYIFRWKTQYACPVNAPSGLSLGSILLITVACLAVVYLVSGILYNKYKKGLSGLELLPNVEFWVAIPGLSKDGVLFVINKIKGKNGYQQL